MTGALGRLRPRRVVLESGPAELLARVAEWAAARPGVALSRRPGEMGPGDLLVTDDPVLSRRAIDAGTSVLLAGALAEEVPEGWTSTALEGGEGTVIAPAPLAREGLLAGAAPPVTVVVPVHNAPGELRRCLDALARNTTAPAELLLVDDASTEPDVGAVLDDVSGWPGVTVLRNVQNLGFTATVNRGLRACRGDAVVLNSDTEVGPHWLERLQAAARRAPGIGTATACSDNAGAFSVPTLGEANPVPIHLDGDATARVVAQAVGDAPVATPTANGFCMYLRREMLDDVGLLDEEAFPRGYGEENDLCMRADGRGWRHVVDPGTFVRHVREASFGTEKAGLAHTGRAVLDRRHPGYTARVREFVGDPGYAAARDRVARAFAHGGAGLPRILFVIHEGGGGSPLANFELMAGLQDRFECLLLTSDRRRLRLDRMAGAERVSLDAWDLERPTRALDFTREDHRRIVEGVLRDRAIDLVHVRHLFKHTFDVPVVAARLGIPVVFSFHDYYFSCPTVHLLDERDRYCAGECTPGPGSCRVPDAGLGDLPPLKHAFVHQWREEVQAMLAGVDAFVTTSEHAREVHRRTLPSIADRPFAVIPHGRSLQQVHGLARPPAPGGPLRILLAGNIDAHKGAGLVRELRRRDADGRLDVHLLGGVADEFTDIGTVHGRYAPDELPERVRAIGPAVIGLFSITAETFSHTISEAWSMGVPVVATDLGAPAERLREHGGGWLVPHDDPDEALRRLLQIADDPAEYARQARRADLRGHATVTEMADGYAAVYTEVADQRRSLCAPASARGARSLHRRGTARVSAIVSGAGGVHPGSTYVRVVRPHRHPGFTRRITTRIRYPADGLAADADVALVQRTAIPPEHIPILLEDVAGRGVPLVVDLDDHLLLKGQDDAEYGHHQDALRDLLDAAAMVTVSTEALEQALRDDGVPTVLVPNALDERLFLGGGVMDPPRASPDADRAVRLVYVGSPTHGEDLELLRPAVAELERRAPGRYALEIVGVQPPGVDESWFERLAVPDDSKPYPRFVAWLREQRPRWHIGLAPLVENPFNGFKSDLKWLEYTGLGLPVLASDRAPYQTIRDHRTGRLLPDDPVAWADAIEELAGDPRVRDGMVQAAWAEVTTERLLRHQVPRLAELLLGVKEAG